MAEAANLLRHETSPYLLQHADNPVHWRPWGAAALEEARETNRPILLSIGYAACHWCHVMAHESFEDPATAALMNAHFVNIKVDREERPDIDHLYMSALHALGEQGGWPLTMFIAPDGSPFWGGTYFPPEPRWGRPSFSQILHGVSEAWRDDGDMVKNRTASLARVLAAMSQPNPGDLPAPVHLDAVAAALLRMCDPEQGGLKGAMKFPNPPIFGFFGRTHSAPGRAGARTRCTSCFGGCRRVASTTTSAAAIHGIPPTRSGWCRISRRCCTTTRNCWSCWRWRTRTGPHPLYAAARRRDRRLDDARHDSRASVDGRAAFAASEDADSEGEEGRFYVWTEAEVDGLLGDAAGAFKQGLERHPGRQLGGTHDPAPHHPGRDTGAGERAGPRAEGVFDARARRVSAWARRQGAGGLERLGDRRPGTRIGGVRPPRVAGARGAGAGFHFG